MYGCGHDQTTPIAAHMFNNTHPVPCKPHANFQPGWSFNLLLLAKQLLMGVALAKPHPYVGNNAYPDTWRPHIKVQPDLSFN